MSSLFRFGLFLSLLCVQTVHGADLFRDEQFAVNVTQNVQYGIGAVVGNAQGIPLLLDLYEPVGVTTEGALPAVVFVHGGAFVSGGKSEFSGLGRRMAARGYVAVSINYRLSGDNPDQEIFFDTTEEMTLDGFRRLHIAEELSEAEEGCSGYIVTEQDLGEGPSRQYKHELQSNV